MRGIASDGPGDFVHRLVESAEASNSLWCLELELEPTLLSGAATPQTCEKHISAVLHALDEAGLLPSALHPISSSFAQYGLQGWQILDRVLAPWRGRLPILLSAPFGESARRGAQAAATVFDAWRADAAILNPWVGSEFLKPFLDRLPGRGLYIYLRTPGQSAAHHLAEASLEEGAPGAASLDVSLARGLRRSPLRSLGAVVGPQGLANLAHLVATLSGDFARTPKPLLVSGANGTGHDIAGIAEALRLSSGESRTFRVGLGLPVLYARPSWADEDPVSAAVLAARRVHALLQVRDLGHGAPAAAVRILLVEDHGLVRRAFRNVLEQEEDLEVVAEVATAEEALDQVGSVHPDVILLDLGLPGMSGLEATRRLRALGCPARILVLSASEDIDDVTASLGAGAHGYMHKRIHAEDLVDSVRRAARGEPVIPRDMVAPFLEHQAREKRSATPLSEREQEVLALLAEGCKNSEIARRLATAEGTVKTHVRNIYRKLGIGTRREAMACASSLGLV